MIEMDQQRKEQAVKSALEVFGDFTFDEQVEIFTAVKTALISVRSARGEEYRKQALEYEHSADTIFRGNITIMQGEENVKVSAEISAYPIAGNTIR